MIAPKRKPQEFGFSYEDTHLVFNSSEEMCKVFNGKGSLVTKLPALCNGQHWNWKQYQGDTPPGLYKLGEVWDDYLTYGKTPPYSPTVLSYGWITFDMVDLEGNEDNNDRAGICLHGGGSGLGFPGCWLPYQDLLPTLGCIRMHNNDLHELILPLTKKGTVYCSVYQD